MLSTATCRAVTPKEAHAEQSYGLEKLHADQSYMLTRAVAYLQSMQCRVTVKNAGSYR